MSVLLSTRTGSRRYNGSSSIEVSGLDGPGGSSHLHLSPSLEPKIWDERGNVYRDP